MCAFLFCIICPWPVLHAGHPYQFGPYGVDGDYSGEERSEVTLRYISTPEHVLVLTVFRLAERA